MDQAGQGRFDELLKTAIGDKIRAARTESRLSQEELAAAAGVSRSAVQRMEQGRAAPDVIDFARICGVLDISWAAVFESAREKAKRLIEVQDRLD